MIIYETEYIVSILFYYLPFVLSMGYKAIDPLGPSVPGQLLHCRQLTNCSIYSAWTASKDKARSLGRRDLERVNNELSLLIAWWFKLITTHRSAPMATIYQA